MGVASTPKPGVTAGGGGGGTEEGRQAADLPARAGAGGCSLPSPASARTGSGCRRAGSPGAACTVGHSPRDGAARPALASSGTAGLAACPVCSGVPPCPACGGVAELPRRPPPFLPRVRGRQGARVGHGLWDWQG